MAFVGHMTGEKYPVLFPNVQTVCEKSLHEVEVLVIFREVLLEHFLCPGQQSFIGFYAYGTSYPVIKTELISIFS